MPSGHEGFFRRLTDLQQVKKYGAMQARGTLDPTRRLGKLAELYGPSIPHVTENRPEFNKMVQVDAGARLELQMEREVAFILTGTSKVKE